jgi:cytochrome c peroxidase
VRPIEIGVAAICGMLVGCDATAPTSLVEPSEPTRRYATSDDPFEPLPLEVDYDIAFAALGETLYADPILSGDRTISCLDCHDLRRQGGTDGRPVANLPTRDRGITNVSTVFNVAFNYQFGWIGKYDTMEEHLDAPMGGPLVMNITWDEVVRRLHADEQYRQRFLALFDDGVTADNVRRVLAEYQRTLVTPNAKFDRFLRGEDHDGLDDDEQRGYALFKELGCASCHQGIGVGGNMLQKFGVMVDFPIDREPTPADLGRYKWTRLESDRFMFRVPSLRNVAVTAPYFHDGSAETLDEAVKTMALHQLGRDLDDESVRLIAAFLNTLTGTFEGEILKQEREALDR